MANDTMAVIQALLQRQALGENVKQNKPVLTLAYDHGCGGEQVAARLAEQLNLPLYDKALLQKIATAAGSTPEVMAQFDEKARSNWTDWLHAFSQQHSQEQGAYYRHLVNVVLNILHSGGVIVGRGAQVILAHHRVFPVRLVGSLERCAQRLANENGLDFTAAREEIERVNHEKGKFVWDYFKHRHNNPTHFDLMLNTDHLSDAHAVADLIIAAFAVYQQHVIV